MRFLVLVVLLAGCSSTTMTQSEPQRVATDALEALRTQHDEAWIVNLDASKAFEPDHWRGTFIVVDDGVRRRGEAWGATGWRFQESPGEVTGGCQGAPASWQREFEEVDAAAAADAFVQAMRAIGNVSWDVVYEAGDCRAKAAVVVHAGMRGEGVMGIASTRLDFDPETLELRGRSSSPHLWSWQADLSMPGGPLTVATAEFENPHEGARIFLEAMLVFEDSSYTLTSPSGDQISFERSLEVPNAEKGTWTVEAHETNPLISRDAGMDVTVTLPWPTYSP